ncbi:MAG: type IV toxin-antitoxin system AbiEi family antitoxin [Chloroflexota bacterium]|nr:type IV toxin-antitoxin system AbiEi family antitoxin [Chloroflexota bacterium]
MRQKETEARFLREFDTLYPRIRFRGLRRFTAANHSPYYFALRAGFGQMHREVLLLCVPIPSGDPQEVKGFIGRIEETETPAIENETLPCLIAPYFSKEGRTLCEEHGIAYLDLAGNANIETADVYFSVVGKTNKYKRKRTVRSPFEGKSERIVRRLLMQPQRHWHMRSLADAAQVSLGLASMATSALAEEGFVTKNRSGLDLFDAGALLEAWSESYDIHRNTLRTYRAEASVSDLATRLAEQRDDLRDQYALTLWSGADRLLRQNRTTLHLALYWAGAVDHLLQRLQLSEDRGETYVFVFRPYDESLIWERKETEHGLLIAHPLQIYLDLASGDEQEQKLAGRLRARLLPY